MSEEQKGGSAASDTSGSAGGSTSSDTKTTTDTQNPDHKRAVSDMLKFKNERDELASKLKAIEEKQLESEKNWQSLAARFKKEAETEREEKNKLVKSLERTQKFDEVKKAALEQGLLPTALTDLELFPDLDGVAIEKTDQGRFIIHGAKDFVEKLKGSRPHWFEKKTPPKVDSGGGKSGAKTDGAKVTPEELTAAERAYKQGKMSKADYHALFRKYTTQQ